jgi:hypothetical protein
MNMWPGQRGGLVYSSVMCNREIYPTILVGYT